MAELIDRHARERFVREVEQPFSVIAPAGVGKTHSIIERVAAMLAHSTERVALVTYTKKAAEQMRERLEAKLRSARLRISGERVFIGTIHSLCVSLMDKYALAWALPHPREVLANPEEAWLRYIEETPNPFEGEEPRVREWFLRYFGGFDSELLLNLPNDNRKIEFCAPPVFSFQKLFQASFKGSPAKTHERLTRWANEFLELSQQPRFIMPELPKPPEETSSVFALYEEVFSEFNRWRGAQGMMYARLLAQNFRQWRLARGFYLYDDLIELVGARAGDVEKMSVVLDEAQDTSPAQLRLLKNLALEKNHKLQLTMVGDPQQSIYSSRASLPEYLKMHREMIERHGAEELTFQVTFRCSQSVVAWANRVGPLLLPGGQQQARFVELFAKPQASAGSVARMKLIPAPSSEETSSEERDWNLAQALAQQLKTLQPNRASLHHIAILAPRREWLFKLAEKLTVEGFRVQIHAQASVYTPAERLMRALVHLLAHPFDAFELVGLLRETTSIDDTTLAGVIQRTPELLTLLTPPDKSKLPQDVCEALGELHLAREKSLGHSLARAIVEFLSLARIDDKIRAIDIAHGGTLWPAWQQEKMRVLSLAASGRTAAELVRGMEDESIDAPIEPGALQLMTMHKAKGLEWSAVFLPFLHRPLNPRPPSYPTVDPADKSRLAWKISMAQASIAEHENFARLLYVALTRAKENLVLVDDAAFYEPGISLARFMNIQPGGEFYADFQNLPEKIQLELPQDQVLEAPVPTGNIMAGRPAFLPVVTPSSLVHAAEPLEVLPVNAEGRGGLNYGEWWHVMWHRVLTHTPPDLEAALMAEAKAGSFASRAQKEIELLKKSPLWALINNPQNKKLSEVPFVLQMENAVMEGRIDLMIYEGDKIWVLDWKTDHLPPEQIFSLYGAQAHAYEKALGQLLAKPIEARLYSTVHGAWQGAV